MLLRIVASSVSSTAVMTAGTSYGLRMHLGGLVVRGVRRQHADLEQHVFLAREIEVEQRLRHTRRPADVGDRRAGIAVRAPQRHRRLHQRLLGRVRARLLKRGTALTLVSNCASRNLAPFATLSRDTIVDPSLTYRLALPAWMPTKRRSPRC